MMRYYSKSNKGKVWCETYSKRVEIKKKIGFEWLKCKSKKLAIKVLGKKDGRDFYKNRFKVR